MLTERYASNPRMVGFFGCRSWPEATRLRTVDDKLTHSRVEGSLLSLLPLSSQLRRCDNCQDVKISRSFGHFDTDDGECNSGEAASRMLDLLGPSEGAQGAAVWPQLLREMHRTPFHHDRSMPEGSMSGMSQSI